VPHTLFPHQEDALNRIRESSRVALFMQMRLGKTPVIIRWAMAQTDAPRRILVVAPMSTLDDWADELRREGVPEPDIVRLDGIPSKTRMESAEGGSGWYLINFEGVRVNGELSDLPWQVVIVDESTTIRNPQAKVTKALSTGYQHVPCRAILSGDPAPEGPMDYFSQFQFLHGNFMGFGNYWAFRNAKFEQHPKLRWDWRPKTGVRDEIKAYVHAHAVVMTRQQVGIGGRKMYERRIVEMNPAQRAAIKQIVTDFQYEYIETNFAVVRDVWLARIAGGFSPDKENPELLSNAKTDELITLMKGELKKESVVVWFRFNEELHHVVASLKRKGIEVVGVTGADDRDARINARQHFNAGRYQVICVQTRLGRMGWNLSRASTAIYYSNLYDWESRSQSEDRIVHPTKRDPLLYIDLITNGSMDGEVVRLLREKRTNAAAFMRQLNSAVWAQFWSDHETKEETRSRPASRAATTQKTQNPRVTRHYPKAR
jgi:SNF2 family DNA or RNA helicase